MLLYILAAQSKGLMPAGSLTKAATAGVTSRETTPELEPENRVFPTITGSRWLLNTRAYHPTRTGSITDQPTEVTCSIAMLLQKERDCKSPTPLDRCLGNPLTYHVFLNYIIVVKTK